MRCWHCVGRRLLDVRSARSRPLSQSEPCRGALLRDVGDWAQRGQATPSTRRWPVRRLDTQSPVRSRLQGLARTAHECAQDRALGLDREAQALELLRESGAACLAAQTRGATSNWVCCGFTRIVGADRLGFDHQCECFGQQTGWLVFRQRSEGSNAIFGQFTNRPGDTRRGTYIKKGVGGFRWLGPIG